MIRQACAADAEPLARIYNESIGAGAFANCDTEPLTPEAFGERVLGDPARAPVVVYESGGELAGFAAVKRFSVLRGLPNAGELTLYVSRRRRGWLVPARLMVAALGGAQRAGYQSVVAIVFEKNKASIEGLTAAGFRATARLREVALLDGVFEDMVWLCKDLAGDVVPAQYRGRFGGG